MRRGGRMIRYGSYLRADLLILDDFGLKPLSPRPDPRTCMT